MINELITKLRYYVVFLLFTVVSINAYEYKLYTNESYNKKISTKYFNVFYNQKNWQLANWFATKVDSWADEVHTARGFKPSIKIDLYLVHDSMVKNAFSSYDRLYLLTNKIINFTQPHQNEWMEDVFKHEYGHNTVSLGNANKFLIYSGIDGLVKFRKSTVITGTLQEGSSVLLESHYGKTSVSGRLNSAPFIANMLYNVDKGYLVDFWKSDDSRVGANKYIEGAHFFEFIHETYGEDKWRNTFNGYVNSYWNMIAYRFPDFLAKELEISYGDLIKQYNKWLAKKSIEYTPTNILQGEPVAGQTGSVGALLDIIDNDIFFVSSAGNGKLKISSLATKANAKGIYKQSTKATYYSGRGANSNAVVLKNNNGFVFYHRTNTNRSLLGQGLDSYYIKKDTSIASLSSNFGNSVVENTQNAEFILPINNRTFVVTNMFDKYQLHDPINSEIVLAYNQNFVIDRPRYSKEQNAIYFAATKTGDTASYIFSYNLATKQLTTLVQGMSPFMYKNDLYFVNLTGTDKALNAYKLNLNNNQVVKLTNLKYGLFEVMANDNSLFYTAFNNRGSAEAYMTSSKGVYVLEQDKWLNEPHNELVTAARNYNVNATNSSVPTPQAVDKGVNAYTFMPVLKPVNFLYTLDGNLLVNFRNQKNTIEVQAGLVTNATNRRVFEDPANWQNENGEYSKKVKDVLQDSFDLNKKDLYARVLYSPGLGASGLARSSKYSFLEVKAFYNKEQKYKTQYFEGAIKADIPNYLLQNGENGSKGWFGGTVNAKQKDYFVGQVQFAPRIWDLNYGVVPVVDLITNYVYSHNTYQADISIQLPTLPKKTDYLKGKQFYDVTTAVYDSFKIGTRFSWLEYQTALEVSTNMQNRYDVVSRFGSGLLTYLKNPKTKEPYGTKYINKKSKTFANTTNYEVQLELNNVLRNVSFPKILPLSNSGYDLQINYIYGNKPTKLQPSFEVLDKYDLDMNSYLNPFGATGSFDVPNGFSNAALDGSLYVIPPISTSNRATDVLEVSLSKLYKFSPYFGSINLGIRHLDVVPYAYYINVWGNYVTELGKVRSRFSSSNLYYGVAARVELSVWRLEPEIALSLFSKETVKKAATHYSGKDEASKYLDGNYKGLLINATIRF